MIGFGQRRSVRTVDVDRRNILQVAVSEAHDQEAVCCIDPTSDGELFILKIRSSFAAVSSGDRLPKHVPQHSGQVPVVLGHCIKGFPFGSRAVQYLYLPKKGQIAFQAAAIGHHKL